MNSEQKKLVDRLNRIFPNLEMSEQGFYLEMEGVAPESEYIPPTTIDWYYIISKLASDGLEIKNIK